MSVWKRKKKKKPKIILSPHPKKEPRYFRPPEHFLDENPAWRIRLVEMVDPFGFHNLNGEKLREIRQKLADLESMTWKEILVTAGDRYHQIPKNQITKGAQERLEQIRQDDVDELLSLRLSGEERIWGILDGAILKILWWDPEHRIYPVQKKHT